MNVDETKEACAWKMGLHSVSQEIQLGARIKLNEASGKIDAAIFEWKFSCKENLSEDFCLLFFKK